MLRRKKVKLLTDEEYNEKITHARLLERQRIKDIIRAFRNAPPIHEDCEVCKGKALTVENLIYQIDATD